MRNGGIKARQKRLEEGADIAKNLSEARKVTAGVLVSNGIHALDNPALVAHIHKKKQVQEEAATEKEATDRNRLIGLISKVAQTRTKKGTGEENAFAKWTTNECSIYLQYKKQPDDAAMPSKVKDLRSRCRSIMERNSPSVSPHASDAENVTDEEQENDDAELHQVCVI